MEYLRYCRVGGTVAILNLYDCYCYSFVIFCNTQALGRGTRIPPDVRPATLLHSVNECILVCHPALSFSFPITHLLHCAHRTASKYTMLLRLVQAQLHLSSLSRLSSSSLSLHSFTINKQLRCMYVNSGTYLISSPGAVRCSCDLLAEGIKERKTLKTL